MKRLVAKVTRTKALDGATSGTATTLKRCLGTIDLTLLGVGSMVGSGIYVLSGIAAKELAGPGIVLSFLLAAVTAILGALCFAEFAARVPRTGSTYLYTYFTMGEMAAFLIGWSTVVGSILGGATNARAWSAYMDSLLDGAIVNFTEAHIGTFSIGAPIAPRPDFVAVAALIVTTLVVAAGANCSSKFNGIFAALNAGVLLFAMVVGFIYADTSNWTSPKHGGFLPFGWTGVLSGATACFWAFSGYEVIAVSVEEANNPHKSVPRAILSALGIVTLLYVGTSAALTLVTNYTEINAEAPLPSAFQSRGIVWARYILSVGPLCGLTTTLLSSSFSIVRIIYAIASDGLLCPVFARVNSCSKVPLVVVFSGGVIMSVCAFCLDLRDLLGFGVVLNLLQYIFVSASVVLLRYKQQGPSESEHLLQTRQPTRIHGKDTSCPADLTADDQSGDELPVDTIDFNDVTTRNERLTYFPKEDIASRTSSTRVSIRPFFHFLRPLYRCNLNRILPVLLFTLFWLMVALAAIGVYGHGPLAAGQGWAITLVLFVSVSIVIIICSLAIYKQNIQGLIVKVPCVPVVPALSMMTAVVLIVSTATKSAWIGTVLVSIIGLVLYFGYGINHSKENFKSFPITLNTSTISLMQAEESDEDEDPI